MTQRLEELLWAELDGELSAIEGRELADLRAEIAFARVLKSPIEAELRDLAARLSEVEDVEVPAGLKARILTAIEERRDRSGEVVAPFVLPKAQENPFFRAKWGYLAAGLFLGGFLVYQLASRLGSGAESELVGTIPPVVAPARPAEGPGEPAGVAPEYLHVARRNGLLEVSIESGGGSLAFSLRAPGLEVRQVAFLDGARGSYEVETGSITLEVTGPGRTELLLGTPDFTEAIRINASGDGIESFEGEFFFNQLPANY